MSRRTTPTERPATRRALARVVAAIALAAASSGACSSSAPTAPAGGDARIRFEQAAPRDTTATDSTGRTRTQGNYQNPLV